MSHIFFHVDGWSPGNERDAFGATTHKRYIAGEPLCPDCHRVYDGVRDSQAHQFRPRRPVDGFSLCGTYAILVFSLPWFISFPLAIIATGAIGILLDRAAYKPLRQAPRISLLISAIGASFLMENLALVIVGGVPKAFPGPIVSAM